MDIIDKVILSCLYEGISYTINDLSYITSKPVKELNFHIIKLWNEGLIKRQRKHILNRITSSIVGESKISKAPSKNTYISLTYKGALTIIKIESTI